MNAKIVAYRQNRHAQTTHHMIVEVEGVSSREEADKLVGKKVTWNSGKTDINGEVASAHGNSGAIRVIFERGMPGQSLATPVSIK